MPPTVSINLCCYNSEKYLEETLQSIFAQTYTDWELVVVNDGSTDSTERIIRRHIADGRPIVYHSQANAGLGNARNKAVELSSGHFIALIDHDDVWRPEKLARQMPLLERQPAVGLVFSDCEIIDSRGQVSGTYWQCWGKPYRGQVFADLLVNDFIPCLTAVLRKEVMTAVGLFRRELAIAEDWDLFLRVARRYPVDFVDKPLAMYRIHETNAFQSLERRYPEIITVTKEWMQRCPDLPQKVRAKLRCNMAGYWNALGQHYLSLARHQEARKHIACSVRLQPLQFRAYLYYGLTLLPPFWGNRVLRWLRSCKTGLKARLLQKR